MPTVCLSAMIKNEAPVIRRMLASVLPYIDSWCICDTGSTDGTQEIIREMLGHLPGELLSHPWANFGHNRSMAVAAARKWADYSLIVDADLVLRVDGEPVWFRNQLTADAYEIRYANGLDYTNTRIINNDHEWKYIGVTHEYIMSPTARDTGEFREVSLIDFADGTNRKDKFRRDIILLDEDRKRNPDNARTIFYLAQSYRDDGQPGKALAWYQERAKMGGFDEEVWYSKFQMAQMMQVIGIKWSQVEDAYLQAYQHRPCRLEPIGEIVEHYIQEGDYSRAMIFASLWWLGPRYPKQDRLFINRYAHNIRLPYNFMRAAYKTGRFNEARVVAIQLRDAAGATQEIIRDTNEILEKL
jgi:glycosyltransferase involved in cell wall biosynthesis